MNPVAAANTISGERASATVTFPITGDAELDAVSGILWVLEETKIAAEAKVRVLQYLCGRFQPQADKDRSEAQHWATMNKYLQHQPAPPFPGPWVTTTSGGTVPSQLGQTYLPTSAP